MRYLVIDTRAGGDWSMDLIFAGLVKLVGYQNVFDYPHKDKHREWDPTRTDWGMERRTLGYTPWNGLVSSSRQEILSTAARRELTVILDERAESFEVYHQLGLGVLRTPVIVVAGHDRFWNDQGIPGVRSMYGAELLHIFIDNVTPEVEQQIPQLGPNISPINLSANFEHYWMYPGIVEKTTDICFFGSTSNPDRHVVVDHIQSHPEWKDMRLDIVLEGRPGVTDTFIPKREYFQRMAQSRVCLNIGGAAAGRAFRFYEIPWAGSFMLSQEFPAKQLHPFVDGVHCGYFANLDELDGWLDSALTCGNSDDMREAIAHQGREHLLRYHTCEARTRYILDVVGHHGS